MLFLEGLSAPSMTSPDALLGGLVFQNACEKQIEMQSFILVVPSISSHSSVGRVLETIIAVRMPFWALR